MHNSEMYNNARDQVCNFPYNFDEKLQRCPLITKHKLSCINRNRFYTEMRPNVSRVKIVPILYIPAAQTVLKRLV